MLGGFIVGFDSDDETIFDRQREFIEKAGITWAMAGMLQAPPTTPLYDRMKKEGRLFEDSEGRRISARPISVPLCRCRCCWGDSANCCSGFMSQNLSSTAAFRSLEYGRPRPAQKAPSLPLSYNLRILAASIWTQGVRSSYRRAYWEFLWA